MAPFKTWRLVSAKNTSRGTGDIQKDGNTTVMKLSESILIGSVVVKAKPGRSYSRKEESGCAIGMAIVGAGGKWRASRPGEPRHSRTVALESWWPWTSKLAPLPCRCWFVPEIEATRKKMPLWRRWFGTRKLPVKEIIPHLFDQHVFGKRDWSIERLAQWVAGVEPTESIAALMALIQDARNEKVMSRKAADIGSSL